MIRVLVVGQTPPPLHGQAIMIERLVQGRFSRVKLYHVRMAFSDSLGEVGRFRLGKIIHLMSVIARIIYHRVVHGTTVLYYPPAGPNRVPVYRDVAILLCTRWMFRHSVLHFHATGVSELYPRLNRLARLLFRAALFHSDATIRITNCGPNDADLLAPRRQFIVPNGIGDQFQRFAAANRDSNEQEICLTSANETPFRILFVGAMRQSKGVLVLIDACHRLAASGTEFALQCAGQFESPEFAAQVRERIEQLQLQRQITLLGEISGEAKWQAFARADVLCLPTHFECETFPTVLLEAMSFQLPVIATRWRGIPDIVDDGQIGILVEPHDSAALAVAIERLSSAPDLRRSMGKLGREKFLRRYTLQRHLEQMEQVFVDVATDGCAAAATASEGSITPQTSIPVREEVAC
ncbi:MAG TPA: glycosyltransferase [Pirellulales bacterium]